MFPSGEGWSVKREGASRASARFTARADAVKAAEKYLKRSDRGELVVHRSDGLIEARRFVGGQEFSPYPSYIDNSTPGAIQLAAFQDSMRDLQKAFRPLAEAAAKLRADYSALSSYVDIPTPMRRQALDAFAGTAHAAEAFSAANEALRHSITMSVPGVPTSSLVTPIEDATRAYVNLSKATEALRPVNLRAMAPPISPETQEAIKALSKQARSAARAAASTANALTRDLQLLHESVDDVPDELLRASKVAYLAEQTPLAEDHGH